MKYILNNISFINSSGIPFLGKTVLVYAASLVLCLYMLLYAIVTVAFGSNKRVHALHLQRYIYLFEYCVMASSSSTLPPSSEQVEVKEEVEEKYEKKGKKEKKEQKAKRGYYPILNDFDEEQLYQLRRARAFGVEAEARYTRARLAKQENEENEKEKEKEKEKEGDGFGVEEVKEIEPTEPPEGSLPPGRVDQGEHPEIYERMKPAKGPFLPGRIN